MKDFTYIYIAGALATIIIIIFNYLDWRKSSMNYSFDVVIVRLKNRFNFGIFILLIDLLGCVISIIINEISYIAHPWYPALMFSLWFIAGSITWKYKFNDVGITPVSGFKHLILTWEHVSYWKWLSYKPDYIFIEFENGKGNLQFKVSENKELLTELLTKKKGNSYIGDS